MDDFGAGRRGWSLKGSVGVLNGGGLTGSVDVARPDLGLCDLELSGRRFDGRWFCVGREAGTHSQRSAKEKIDASWPLPLAEAYVRGRDLVASYGATSDWPYSPQVYWRAGHLSSVPGVAGSLTLLVSVQTHLLDTHPQITVGSKSQAETAIRITVQGAEREESTMFGGEFMNQASTGVCCILRRFTGIPLSYAEFMPGSDFRAVRAWTGGEGNCGVQWQLFSEFLEKGVIRRARVHGAFLRRDGDVEAAAACCEAIERESLPLTT